MIQGARLAKHIDIKQKTKHVQSTVGEDIARQVYFQLSIAEQVVNEPENFKRINYALMRYIADDFKQYIDTRARSDHKRFHHVYEWDRAGQDTARLFNVRIISSKSGATGSLTFLTSRNKNRNGHVFKDKAFVMETGRSVSIAPVNAEFLRFTVKSGEVVYTKKTITIPNPGGDFVAGSLSKAYVGYNNSGAPKRIIKETKLLNKIIKDASKSPPKKGGSSQTKARAASKVNQAVNKNT